MLAPERKAARDRINVNEPSDLYQWSKMFGVTPERLIEAVAKVGPIPTDVFRFLSKPQAGLIPPADEPGVYEPGRGPSLLWANWWWIKRLLRRRKKR